MSELPSIFDVIMEPTEANLNEQVERYGKRNVLSGKFIRLGELPLLTPYADVQPIPGTGSNDIKHIDIGLAVFDLPVGALKTKIFAAGKRALEEEAMQFLDGGTPAMADAGMFSYERETSSLVLFGESFKLGRADDEGRAQTVRFAQEVVGSNIRVTSED